MTSTCVSVRFLWRSGPKTVFCLNECLAIICHYSDNIIWRSSKVCIWYDYNTAFQKQTQKSENMIPALPSSAPNNVWKNNTCKVFRIKTYINDTGMYLMKTVTSCNLGDEGRWLVFCENYLAAIDNLTLIWSITSAALRLYEFSSHLWYCWREGTQWSRQLLRWRDALQCDEPGKWLAMTENGTWWLWETGVRLHVIRCKLKPDCMRLLRLGKARGRIGTNSTLLYFFFFFFCHWTLWVRPRLSSNL